MTRQTNGLLAVALLTATALTPALAQSSAEPVDERVSPPAATVVAKPLWEAGAGFGAIHAPHYPGADQSHTLATPFPIFIYRGRILRSDEKGIRGRFFESEKLTLSVSASFSLPTDSEDNDAREGMPDLDAGVEVGPRLSVALADWGSSSITLEIPARALFVSDFSSVDHAGWVFEPALDFRFGIGKWRLSAEISSLWATSKYNSYYYQVAPEFARADRPAYSAPGGYGRSTYRLGALRASGDWRYGWQLSQHSLSRSQVEDSPLVKQKTATYLGLVVLWTFAKSKQLTTDK